MTAKPFISMRGVRYEYNPGTPQAQAALDGIDLDIYQGEFVAIIGANGSGKSTLARHCNALLLPQAGQVLVAGRDTRDPASLWEIRRRAGMVFQNPDNQIVATSVEEDAAFGPENLGVPPAEIRVRVREALAMVGLEERGQEEPHHLSGGQKQRLAIAGAMAMRPDGLILDEATSMLDPVGRREILGTIRRLNADDGVTIVLITHHMEEAAMAGRVLVMSSGRIVLDGPPSQVFADRERLLRIGLDVPLVARVADELRRRGLPVPPGVISKEELVKALCP